jgi:alpha/beta superfamily hydrolase
VPAGPVLAWCAKLAAPPRIALLPGVGHFFHGRLSEVTNAVTDAFGADFAAPGSN